MQPPHQSSVFPDLNRLSFEELRFLNESEERQTEFVEEMPIVKEQARILDELISEIEEVTGKLNDFCKHCLVIIEFSEDNLSKEQQLCQLRDAVDSQIEKVTKLAFDNERLYSVYQNLSEKYSPRNIQVGIKFVYSYH